MFRAAGLNIAVNLDDDDEPYLILAFQDAFGNSTEDIALTPQDMEGMIPYIVESLVRSRTILEMVTLWPEQRREIIQNVLFRWAGVIEEDPDGS